MNDQEIESMSSTFFPHCCIIEVNSYFLLRFFFVLPFMTASYFKQGDEHGEGWGTVTAEINVNQRNILLHSLVVLMTSLISTLIAGNRPSNLFHNDINGKSIELMQELLKMWFKCAHLSKESLLLTWAYKSPQKIIQF